MIGQRLLKVHIFYSHLIHTSPTQTLNVPKDLYQTLYLYYCKYESQLVSEVTTLFVATYCKYELH